MTATLLLRGAARYHKLASRNRSLLAAIIAVTFVSFQALAQVSSGTVVGTITDASGGAVPNAKVEAKNVETTVVSTTETTGAGEYRLGGLLPGNYTITASASGFTGASH